MARDRDERDDDMDDDRPRRPKRYEDDDNPRARGPKRDIPNYLVQSILVTLCCCLPLGIVSIVFAAQVNPAIAAGDYDKAEEASKKAKQFSTIAFVLGLIVNVAYVALQILAQGR